MWQWREHDWRNWLYGSVSKRVLWNRNLPWVTMSSADSKRLHRLRRGEEHCSGISLIFGSNISHDDMKPDIRLGELISVVKQP